MESNQAKMSWDIIRPIVLERIAEFGTNANQLANETGLKKSIVYRMLNGETTPSLNSLLLILAALKLNIHIVPREIDKMIYPPHKTEDLN